jgi:hypothetical protein
MGEVRSEIDDLKLQLKDTHQKVDNLHEQLAIARVRNAELAAGQSAQRSKDNIFKIVGIASAALLGVGVDLFEGGGDSATLGMILIGVGIVG